MWAKVWIWLLLVLGIPFLLKASVHSSRIEPMLAEPVPMPNHQRGTLSYVTETVVFARAKAEELKQLNSIPFRWLETVDFKRRTGVSGGEHLIATNFDEGRFVGSTGAGPCIGLILIVPSQHGRTYAVYHFTATEDPSATIAELGTLPSGTRAALFGGDNSSGSNFTLRGVLNHLRGHAIEIEGYSDSVGLWIDSTGRYYRYRTDVDSRNE